MAIEHAAREQVLAWLKAHESDMFALLEKIVNIDSGSRQEEGIAKVADCLRDSLDVFGIATRVHESPGYGPCLVAAVGAEPQPMVGHYLLLGHMDTVFSPGTAAARPYAVCDKIAHGPGVADMKSGLVMNVFVAKAFAELGITDVPLLVVCTCDEEIASPSSRDLIMRFATGARAVFNAEPGRVNSNFVVERKGALFLDFEVYGVAAHSGVNQDQGRSAIEALAHKILALHALTDRKTGVTANVGTVHGGLTINTVAAHVKAQLDVRFTHLVDREALHERIRQIILTPHIEGCSAEITREIDFLPLVPTEASRAVAAAYTCCAHDVGLMITGEATGGSADSGFCAAVGAPTICGTGPVGGHAHTAKEYCELMSVVPRAQTLAATILALAENRTPC